MKKYLAVLLSLTFLFSLTACGGKENEKAAFSPADAQALLDSSAFSEALEPIDPETACALYGIDPATVTEAAVYGSTGTTAEEIAIFVLCDEEAARAAYTALGYRVEDRKTDMSAYLPGEVPKLDKALLEIRGCSVLMVVANDHASAEDVLK